MTTYVLPELPYDVAALEPHISARITELHHDKHHAAYVTGANNALEQLAAARESGDFANINKLEKDLAFNLGGHVNHSVWWTNLSPDGGDEPVGELASALDDHFGSFEKFRAHFTAAALGVQGSGWAGLFWDSVGQNLLVQQFFNQESQFAAGTVPLLLLDVWEHAYYLDYQNVRADYVKAFWNVADWSNVQSRFDTAREKTSGLIVG